MTESDAVGTGPSTTEARLVELAARAITALAELEAEIPLYGPRHAKERIATGYARVTPAAIACAARISASDPHSHPSFPADMFNEPLSYERFLKPVAKRARELADTIDRSIGRRRTLVSEQVLAFYATLQALGRSPVGGNRAREGAAHLGELLSPKRSKRHDNTPVLMANALDEARAKLEKKKSSSRKRAAPKRRKNAR